MVTFRILYVKEGCARNAIYRQQELNNFIIRDIIVENEKDYNKLIEVIANEFMNGKSKQFSVYIYNSKGLIKSYEYMDFNSYGSSYVIPWKNLDETEALVESKFKNNSLDGLY